MLYARNVELLGATSYLSLLNAKTLDGQVAARLTDRQFEVDSLHKWRLRKLLTISVLSATKLEHLQPIEPFLFQNFFNFFSFILGGQFLLPQRANNGKGGFIQLQNWMRQGVFSAWGIQTGPFAAHWAHFVPKDFQLFHLHTGRPILITPEG